MVNLRLACAIPVRQAPQPLSPVERSPLLVSARHDADTIRIDGAEQVVGESPQCLPPHSRPDPLRSLRVGQNLVERSLHLSEQAQTKPWLTHLVVLRSLCDFRVSLRVESDQSHDMAARARRRTS